MQWALNFLWYIARQSFILSIPTKGFVSAILSSFFSLILLMLCQKSENWAAASSRKGITSWKFCHILISVQLRCMWREKHSTLIPKERQRRQQLLFWIKIVDDLSTLSSFPSTGNNFRRNNRKFKRNKCTGVVQMQFYFHQGGPDLNLEGRKSTVTGVVPN